jgi:hypothetical protein
MIVRVHLSHYFLWEAFCEFLDLAQSACLYGPVALIIIVILLTNSHLTDFLGPPTVLINFTLL